MPTSTKHEAPLRPPFAGALAGELFDSARQAAGAAAETYLDGLDAVTRAQRRLVAGTPLAPVTEVFGAQVALTRHVLQTFAAGERRTAATAARAAEATERPAARAAEAAERSAARTAETAERPAARAARAATPKPAARRTPRTPAANRASTKPEATKRAAAQRPARKPTARRTPAERLAPARTPGERPAAARTPGERPAAARTPAERPAAAPAPPIPGYESLTAEQLLARLPEVPQRTLAAIRDYERAHGARQAVLERVGALTEPEPVAGYDDLSVEDIQPRLADGDAALATRVRDYERRHKQRAGVIEAAERRIAAA
jgi:hypothetical protein